MMKPDPFRRFRCLGDHTLVFFGYVKGLEDSGNFTSIRQAAKDYARRFPVIDIEPDNLERNYYNVTDIIRDQVKCSK